MYCLRCMLQLVLRTLLCADLLLSMSQTHDRMQTIQKVGYTSQQGLWCWYDIPTSRTTLVSVKYCPIKACVHLIKRITFTMYINVARC